MEEAQYIWKNGKMMPWADATIHVLSHGLHYGTSFFEGIRVYETAQGPAIFRLEDHIKRFANSAKIYGLSLPYSTEELCQVCHDVIRENGLKSAYIRPIAYIGYGSLKVAPGPEDLKMDVAVAAFPWGAYLGEEGMAQGIDVCISSWNRVAPNTIPTMAKAGGNYLSGFLVSHEAHERGFTEGIALTPGGTLSEGAGENLFVVKDNVIYTPHAASSILTGITRHTIMNLAATLGYEVKEETLVREFLYLADELFFTGTAAEVTPIRSVDKIQIGKGNRGPVTQAIQQAYFALVKGETDDAEGWLSYDSAAAAAA